jgi:hypothetical protein
MTAPDRAAAVVSRLIADNLIAAPFEDYPDATYYASIVAMVAGAIREAQEETRERCAQVCDAENRDHGWDSHAPDCALAIRKMPLD